MLFLINQINAQSSSRQCHLVRRWAQHLPLKCELLARGKDFIKHESCSLADLFVFNQMEGVCFTSKACHRGCEHIHSSAYYSCPRHLSPDRIGSVSNLHTSLRNAIFAEIKDRKLSWKKLLDVILWMFCCQLPKLSGMRSWVSPSAAQTGYQRIPGKKKKSVITDIHIWTKYGSTGRQLLGIVIQTHSRSNSTVALLQG